MKFTPQINKAINTAARLHDGQIRKGDGLPYLVHPFAVAMILMEYTSDEDVIIAGLLHDTLEDTTYTKEAIEKDFGPRVAQFVLDVTEPPKPLPWQERKDGYLKHLADTSYEAKLICAADKLHNLQSMLVAVKKEGEQVYKKFNAPLDKQLWFYDECLKVLEKDEKMPKPMPEEIKSLIAALRSISLSLAQPLFVAFVVDRSEYKFHVYLINNSSINFMAVKSLTGAYASDEDSLIETSKAVWDKGSLMANSVLEIDQSDLDELDYVIWYELDLVDETQALRKYSFYLPKYILWKYDEKALLVPILERQGQILDLVQRSGGSIEEEVKTMDMRSKYTDYSK